MNYMREIVQITLETEREKLDVAVDRFLTAKDPEEIFAASAEYKRTRDSIESLIGMVDAD